MRILECQRGVIGTLLNPSKRSATERKRSYLFLAVYILSIIAFCCHFIHFISGWIALLFVQLAQMIITIIYAFSIYDYGDKQTSAMECERTCNPLLDVYLVIRVIQIVQSIWLRSYIAILMFASSLIFFIWRLKKGCQYVDATSLWRDLKKHELESYISLATDVTLIGAVLITMIFSIISKYD
ncbi:unnamed protein product [Phytomonas sp. Hart1]|nr:unnamed protein product [Phytomonas sp. Hart1]|eukprot:CCW68452.1 unnamed protein product [Phytomonas sp. isolate Hart1]